MALINQEKAANLAKSAAGNSFISPGFSVVSGGGMAFGQGISVRASIGESTGEALQSGGSLNVWAGIQSAVSN